MGTPARQLRQILQREVAVHRELLRLARSRHILLKQGRFDDAADLAVREAAYVVALRDLEAKRRQLHRNPSIEIPDAAKLARQIATLIRGLGAVERANRALWSQRILAPVLTIIEAATTPRAQARLN